MAYNYAPGLPNYNAAATVATETLTIGLDYYTITTGVNISPAAVGSFTDVVNASPVVPSVADFNANASYFVAGTIPNDFSQDALDRLVEIVSQRGQPVIMGTPVANASNVFTFKFAVEHKSVWGVVANSTAQSVPVLANAIQVGGIDFGFNTDTYLAVTVANSF